MNQPRPRGSVGPIRRPRKTRTRIPCATYFLHPSHFEVIPAACIRQREHMPKHHGYSNAGADRECKDMRFRNTWMRYFM